MSFQKGTYLPQTYIIQEEMIATEHVSDMEQLGSFIYRLCSGKETYRLKRRSTRRRKSLAVLSCPCIPALISSVTASGRRGGGFPCRWKHTELLRCFPPRLAEPQTSLQMGAGCCRCFYCCTCWADRNINTNTCRSLQFICTWTPGAELIVVLLGTVQKVSLMRIVAAIQSRLNLQIAFN